MRIVLDLVPWEPIFLGSGAGLGGLVVLSIGRRRWLRPLRWPMLILVVALILPWLLVPRFGARLRQGMTSNVVSTSPQAEWPELRPRRVAVPPGTVADALPGIFRQLGWRLVELNGTTFKAEVPVARIGLLTDDFVGTLSEENGTTLVNVTSSARVGQGDLGENRRHVVQFWAVLEQHFGSVEPV